MKLLILLSYNFVLFLSLSNTNSGIKSWDVEVNYSNRNLLDKYYVKFQLENTLNKSNYIII